ncbi:hypothetical protein WH47_06162 [Habropoda laboriosa]|uniref:Uncharacterized protein n=1 Tax=Habropoda laboriosa TaxID=597456 RepID=A0A0L7QTD0_9HYME|nr:hypothetical protein WH47_06162 [Habropoda laboriosa]
MIRDPISKTGYELSAANGTPIATYGTKTLTLNLGLRRDFTWRFVVADVSKPIIGADFLAHYGLLVDIRNQRLIDQFNSNDKNVNELKKIRTLLGNRSNNGQMQTLLANSPQQMFRNKGTVLSVEFA